ncbi:DUF4856 domain-containing protein [Capnocytophaga sp.]|uniref:DUF4856 domain-containing protein n=1 Tax=Capnocytophaga sp. TaxID=44737 RepID=UPI0026DCACBD|nr:DUF4856 domain-containing protein [Capnocytophaga sp.]MDO5104716.1 DUF4856 domain-containing protein [Capnocytophaga sp.]
MKKIYILMLASLVIACNKGEGETVESAFIDPTTLPQLFKYSFSRNGTSSVDVLECSLLEEPINALYTSYLKSASITNQVAYDLALSYYKNGLYHIKPEAEVARSPLHNGNREQILQDILQIINTSAKIGGYGSSSGQNLRRREAAPGQTGYLGFSIGDPNRSFADEKGVVIAEVFDGMLKGAVYLDKILNYHLNEHLLDNESLRTNHENVVLPLGHNYTELEHHWDLAYGYYAFWKNLARPEIPILKNSERTIFNAFVQGRIELGRYRYDAMKQQIRIIREELSKVAAARAMNYLIGSNTIANLKEGNGSDAFVFISKGIGLVYALQFTRKPDGTHYMTYDECQNLLNQFQSGNGLWLQQQLLADETTAGSLLNIAGAIGKAFGISINDLKR